MTVAGVLEVDEEPVHSPARRGCCEEKLKFRILGERFIWRLVLSLSSSGEICGEANAPLLGAEISGAPKRSSRGL